MYEIGSNGTITYLVPPNYKLDKGGQGAHDIFRRGVLALDDGACGPLLFQKGLRGAFSQQQIKHLRFIHITSYSILNIHQVFMLIEIAKIQFIGTQEVKSFNKPCGHEPYWRLCYN